MARWVVCWVLYGPMVARLEKCPSTRNAPRYVQILGGRVFVADSTMWVEAYDVPIGLARTQIPNVLYGVLSAP